MPFVVQYQICYRVSDVAARPTQKYPYLDYDYRSPTVQGLYFTGTIAHSLDYRQSAGGFIHGFRYSGNKIFNIMQRSIVLTQGKFALPEPFLCSTCSLKNSKLAVPSREMAVDVTSGVQPYVNHYQESQ